jgi:hypothetical protein
MASIGEHRGGDGGWLDHDHPAPVRWSCGGSVVCSSFSDDSRPGSPLVVGLNQLLMAHEGGALGLTASAGAKSPCQADDGDTCGHHHLLEGIIMVMFDFLARAPRESPDLVIRSGGGVAMSFSPWRQRGSYVVSSLEAPPRLFGESSVHQLESLLRPWASGALCTPSPSLLGRRLLQPGAVPPFTHRLLGAYGRAVRWLVPYGSWSRPMKFPSSGVMRSCVSSHRFNARQVLVVWLLSYEPCGGACL